MNISYVKAESEDADTLITIYNASFYEDYIKYGECPAYGRSKEKMQQSIERFPKLMIYDGDTPIGVMSAQDQGGGEYYLGCLCIVPKYQHKGIGSAALQYLQAYYSNWRKITLVTPADKISNINFYTRKCGFKICGTKLDGNVQVAELILERKQP